MSGILFEQYRERLARTRASGSAQKNHARTYAMFAAAGLDSETVTDVEIEEWLAGLPVAPRTRELHFQNVSAVYRYAQRRGVRKDCPTEFVRLPRVADEEPNILSVNTLRQIRDRCTVEWQELMFHLLAYGGIRRTELRMLQWEDVTPESLRIVGKGGKLRYVPVHPALGEVLTSARRTGDAVIPGPRGKSLTDTGLYARFKQIAPGDVTCHDFRRTVATSLAENDVPERIIDQIMGWAPRTVGRKYYIRRADSRAQAGILQLYADRPL